MVSTSNWPPLVAMSVVTRWRSTFSSSVTHLTVMSGFLAVKSLVSPCMRIMSGLLTVAIVSVVVSATEGTETKSAAAPKRTPRTFLTVTSHFAVLSIYPHVGLMFTPGVEVVKRTHAVSVALTSGTGKCREVVRREFSDDESGENGARGGFVGNEAVDQASRQRGLDGGNLGLPDRGGNRGRFRRH